MIQANFDNMASIYVLIGVHSIDSTSRFQYGANRTGFLLNELLDSITSVIQV